jgi:5'-3' exonuclease
MNTVYLIDASIYVFRAWFSMDDHIVDAGGRPANAVYGFGHFLAGFLERARPAYVAAVFDESLGSTFRNRIYPHYKANRDPAPPELKQQFRACRQMCRALGISEFASRHYEADDIIGTITARARRYRRPVTILSRDKDLLQLLGHADHLWDFADDRLTAHAQVPERFGVRADQIADLLALAGDSVDNIPGVPGIGLKTAVALLGRFDNLETLYRNLDQVQALPLRGARRIQSLLHEHKQQAWMSRQLTVIETAAAVDFSLPGLAWKPDAKQIARFFKRMGVGARIAARLQRLLE